MSSDAGARRLKRQTATGGNMKVQFHSKHQKFGIYIIPGSTIHSDTDFLIFLGVLCKEGEQKCNMFQS